MHKKPHRVHLLFVKCTQLDEKRDVSCLMKVNYNWSFEANHDAHVALGENELDTLAVRQQNRAGECML